MDGAEVLAEVIKRIGTNSGVTNINTELNSVLYDISRRADFLSGNADVVFGAGSGASRVISGSEAIPVKRIFEAYITGTAVLEQKSYRDFLKRQGSSVYLEQGTPGNCVYKNEFLYIWPIPKESVTVKLNFSRFHEKNWSEVEFGEEFTEAIIEGVVALLYKGQLFEKLRLNNKKISSRDIAESAAEAVDSTTITDKEGTADDVTVTADEDAAASVNTDDDLDVLTYEFSKDFPEIKMHEKLYEAEIAKLIGNMETEAAVVEYRDI